jgi:hypothetical protein
VINRNKARSAVNMTPAWPPTAEMSPMLTSLYGCSYLQLVRLPLQASASRKRPWHRNCRRPSSGHRVVSVGTLVGLTSLADSELSRIARRNVALTTDSPPSTPTAYCTAVKVAAAEALTTSGHLGPRDPTLSVIRTCRRRQFVVPPHHWLRTARPGACSSQMCCGPASVEGKLLGFDRISQRAPIP